MISQDYEKNNFSYTAGDEGYLEFKNPVNTILSSKHPYKVVSVTTLKALPKDKTIEGVYTPLKLTQANYDEDILNNANVVTIEGLDGTHAVPTTYITTKVLKYSNLLKYYTLHTTLGYFDTDIGGHLTLKTRIKSLIEEVLGIIITDEQIGIIPVASREDVSKANWNLVTTERTKRINSFISSADKIKKLETTVAEQAQTIKDLMLIIGATKQTTTP